MQNSRFSRTRGNAFGRTPFSAEYIFGAVLVLFYCFACLLIWYWQRRIFCKISRPTAAHRRFSTLSSLRTAVSTGGSSSTTAVRHFVSQHRHRTAVVFIFARTICYPLFLHNFARTLDRRVCYFTTGSFAKYISSWTCFFVMYMFSPRLLRVWASHLVSGPPQHAREVPSPGSQARGHRLGTFDPSPVHALGFYCAFGSAFHSYRLPSSIFTIFLLLTTVPQTTWDCHFISSLNLYVFLFVIRRRTRVHSFTPDFPHGHSWFILSPSP